MAESNQIQQVVERIAAEVVGQYLPAIQSEITRRVAQQMGTPGGSPHDASPTEALNAALAAIHASDTQGEILAAMVAGAAGFCCRAALFLLRGQQAHGWQAHGFADNEGVKATALEMSVPLVNAALRNRAPVSGALTDFDGDFLNRFAPPADHAIVLLPLVVRDKVAALLYADAGANGEARVDRGALEAIVRATGLWLEILNARRNAGNGAGTTPDGIGGPGAMHQAASAGSAYAFGAAQAAVMQASPNTPEQELHTKARRFAKLLVDEIRLYNQAEVAEGLQHCDLYSRLKEPIEKSRESYDRRFAGTAAAGADYFTQELVRVLANNDPSVLGAGFPR